MTEYLQADTSDRGVVALYLSDSAIPQLDEAQLQQLRRTVRWARGLYYARRIQAAAKSRNEAMTRRFLEQYPAGKVAGFIGKWGNEWYRIIVTRKQPNTALADAAGLVHHLGDRLPMAVPHLTVEMTGETFLKLGELLDSLHECLDWRVVAADAKPEIVKRLIERERLAPLPEGIFVTSEPDKPSIVIKPTSNPHTKSRRR